MSFTAIYIPEFPVAAWRRTAPALRAQPLAVLDGIAPQERVVALSASACAAGLEHGMGKVQAEAICVEALFRARSIEEEKSAFALTVEIAERFSPHVEAIASPANAYLATDRLAAALLVDSSGVGTLFGSVEAHARRLHKQLRTAGFPASVGAAPNAEAALLLAKSCRQIVCADRDDLQATLARLPTHLLTCDPRVQAVLERWGIRTLGALAALPETALVSRLGQQGRRLQQLARGEADHLLVPEEPEFTLCETTELDSPVELLDSLLFVLSPMLERVLSHAMEHAYALRSVQLILLLERGQPHTIAVRPATPTQNREALLKLLNLELQAHPPAAGILTVTLQGEPATPQTAQRGLFQAQFPDPDRLNLLLARLRSIVGEPNVGSPLLENSHREDAFAIAPFQPRLSEREEAAISKEAPLRLAMRLLRQPQMVRVICRDTEPATLFWQGAHRVICGCAGPWHTSGSWWDGHSWESDLWDVVLTEPSQALRLRLDHPSQNWFVAGLYD